MLGLLVPQLMAQPFPDDRAQCDSSEDACTVGLAWMASVFPVRVNSYEPPPQGYHGILNPDVGGEYLLPGDYEIDSTGGLVPPRAEYRAPEQYFDGAGNIAFVGTDVTVKVTSAGFTPANISVLPGTTITWALDTFETVRIRSDNDGMGFDSGPINRNWAPTYAIQVRREAEYTYTNAEQPSWKMGFGGRIAVVRYNCSSYQTCTTCLAYTQCLWCSGNGTCLERNSSTNLPLDSEPVVAISYVAGRAYQSIRYMEGYNAKLARVQYDWYPWPPYRRVPKPVADSLIPSYFDPLSSDQCSAYMRTRDGSQCEDYANPPLKNRVHGVETARRPTLTDFFACYDHVSSTWAKSDLAPAIPWDAWPAAPHPSPRSADLDGMCCQICSACDVHTLVACNISCGTTQPLHAQGILVNTSCPWKPHRRRALEMACGTPNSTGECTTSSEANVSHCHQLLAAVERSQGDHNMSSTLGDAFEDVGRHRRRQDSTEALRGGSILDTTFVPFAERTPSPAPSTTATTASASPIRRRAQQSNNEPVIMLTPWEQVPLSQKALMGKASGSVDQWTALTQELTQRYGPRCNATHGCDSLRGACLNVSGLLVYGYDQNGTCTCHPWFDGDECTELILSADACVGMQDVEQCTRIRTQLFGCGDVLSYDALPHICVEMGLSVVQCGEAGYMRGQRDKSGIPNLLGRPESGYASTACAKCTARDGMRAETYAKLCDPSQVLLACQRHEDAASRRLCNYCGADTQGSVMPQRGRDRACSFYRGTCIGSVEKRIRGIVPPNTDIIGQTAFGGLRYCKKPTTFSSVKHYFTDDDIMQVGQTCQEGTTPVFEGWDWSRQHDNPQTVRDHFGLACLDPDDENTCPLARNCIDARLCYTDTPDWQDVGELIRSWGLEKLRQFADDSQCNTYNEQQYDTGSSLQSGGSDAEVVFNPCTFTRHQLILDPSTAYVDAHWPFLSDDYLTRYTQVEWSVQTHSSPPPSPPPPRVVVFG